MLVFTCNLRSTTGEAQVRSLFSACVIHLQRLQGQQSSAPLADLRSVIRKHVWNDLTFEPRDTRTGDRGTSSALQQPPEVNVSSLGAGGEKSTRGSRFVCAPVRQASPPLMIKRGRSTQRPPRLERASYTTCQKQAERDKKNPTAFSSE